MYFFLSGCYTEPSVLIEDPESLREEIVLAEEQLALNEALKTRLKTAKETLSRLSSLSPDSLPSELYERIERAEEEHERLFGIYEAKKEELREALFTLGRLKERRFSP